MGFWTGTAGCYTKLLDLRPLGVGVKDGGWAEIMQPEVLFAGGCKAQRGAEAKKLPPQVIWGLRREPSTIILGHSCFLGNLAFKVSPQ